MMTYRLVDSFDIDDGSLAALTKEQCFALGTEWEAFRARVLAGESFTSLCNSANAARLALLAERHGKFVEHHIHSPGWSIIFVGANRT
jgi:hypothetical protein